METSVTLTQIFEKDKETLRGELTGLTLPGDGKKIQEIVADYLNSMFGAEASFRDSLTPSEDYILQSALVLLNAQQGMANQLLGQSPVETAEDSATDTAPGKTDARLLFAGTMAGAAVGGAIGTLGGPWMAVFGAIAGTAVGVYCVSLKQASSNGASPAGLPPGSIDTDVFLAIVKSVCESVDQLILTFRTQVNKVVNKYEQQEKPTLETQYSILLERIQSLLGVAYAETTDDKHQDRLLGRCEDLDHALRNYGLKVVRYDETTAGTGYFEVEEDADVPAPVMLYPAIVKNGVVVKPGKVIVNPKLN